MNPLTVAVQGFTKAAAQAAMRGAAEYIRANNLTLDDAAVVASIRAEVKAALPVALEDAKQAFDCGMMDIGTATFLASMKLAGIKAAQQVAA